jgi:Tfp pilus assembly protein PilF
MLSKYFAIVLLIITAACSTTHDYQKAAYLVKIGLEYTDDGQYDLAIDNFNDAIDADPGYAKAYNDRGNVYFMKGQYDLAIKEYRKAIELDPHFAKAHNNLGFAHFEKDQLDHAIKEFSLAIAIYMIEGDVEQACADFMKACELGVCITYDMLRDRGVCEFSYYA